MGTRGSYGPVIRDNGALISYGIGEWADARRFEDDAGRVAQPGRNDLYSRAYTIRLAVGRGDTDVEESPRLGSATCSRAGSSSRASTRARYALARAERALWRGRAAAAVAAADEGLALVRGEGVPVLHVPAPRHGRPGRRGSSRNGRATRGVRRTTSPPRSSGIDRHIDAIARTITTHPPEPEGARRARRRAAERPGRAVAGRRRAAPRGVAGGDRGLGGAGATVRGGLRPLARRGGPPRAGRPDRGPGSPRRRLAVGDPAGRRAVARRDRDARPAGQARPLGAVVGGDGRRVQRCSSAASPSGRAADEFGLTRREREVLALVAEGWTNRQVADHLFISENTAGVHVSNILGKLGASGRTEAAAIAHRLGLAAEVAEA